MTNIAEHSIPGLSGMRPPERQRAAEPPPRPGCADARWPELAAALDGLRASHRGSIRIVDADCGTGALLLCAARHARAIGFTAIEARGVDSDPALVDRARAAAAEVHDPAIGITLETGDLTDALGVEADFPADIVLWHGCDGCEAAVAEAVAAAGRRLIADPHGRSELAA
jgi:SAM-dependent methyltransferase